MNGNCRATNTSATLSAFVVWEVKVMYRNCRLSLKSFALGLSVLMLVETAAANAQGLRDGSGYNNNVRTMSQQRGDGSRAPNKGGGPSTPRAPAGGKGGTTPRTPRGSTPSRPGGSTPLRPGGSTPSRPGGSTPSRPGGGYVPRTPRGGTPSRPGATLPRRPGTSAQQGSGRVDPKRPGGSPTRPSGGSTPRIPGGTLPRLPGIVTPRSAPGVGRASDGGRIIVQSVPTRFVGKPTRFNNTYVYRFPSGVYSRLIYTTYPTWIYPWFLTGLAYYPYYVNVFTIGYASWSPYYYYGVLPPYISNADLVLSVPQRGYLAYASLYPSTDDYYLTRSVGLPTGVLQQRAIDDICDSWINSNISPLALHTLPNVRIGVYLQGVYKYSMTSNDYLDITHDAQRNMTTLSFDLRMISTPDPGVIVLSGEHRYADSHNVEKTVRVDYALRLINGSYTIIEVGVSQPDTAANEIR